ncbi:MAG: DsrE/DsrF/DrsH-like family protein [Actinomycetota bacterium]
MTELDQHEQVNQEVEEDEDPPKRMALICWSSDLDKVWPVLILATTGAASGMEVDIFFTFWGLRVLQKSDKRITGKNWKQKGESLMDKGGADNLKLGKMHMAGMGTSMIKGLAKDHGVASPQDLIEMALELGVRFHPCQMTMDLYGLTTEDFIDGLNPVCGAAAFLDMAANADIQLFI